MDMESPGLKREVLGAEDLGRGQEIEGSKAIGFGDPAAH